MKRGTPPTEPNARTGESTPPGMMRAERSNSSAFVVMFVLFFSRSLVFTGRARHGAGGRRHGRAGDRAAQAAKSPVRRRSASSIAQ
ncbi:hypothetical protein GCM10022230_17150 [Pseudoclavibacter caeni]